MPSHRLASSRFLLAIACVLLASCATSTRPSKPSPESQNAPPPPDYTTSGAATSSAPTQRLTIQSGSGEKLNLPWFIRDTQDWINR